MRRVLVLTSVLLLVAGQFGTVPADAQVRPIYDRGAAGLVQVLERLQTTASALHTGAHPDDEDSAFMARTARGDDARVAYLALNRGEGGQNILGTELFDALGVIRTEELLQARRLDGGSQFFTRAFDYGFSKSRQEAADKWNERDVLGDMVRVIRLFRPLVVYSRFSGTPADGHGHHELAGYLTPQAFRAAGDPSQFPEQIAEGLRPWQPRKLYRGQGRGGGPATLQIDTGLLDPMIGRSYAAISLEGRSQHKSQSMGTIESLGPQSSGLFLVESLAPDSVAQETSIFDGLDVTVTGLAGLAGLPPGSLDDELQAISNAARNALVTYEPLAPERIIPTLVEGLRATRAARQTVATLRAPEAARADADFLLAYKEQDFQEALVRATGVEIDPLSDVETVVQGRTLGLAVRIFVPDGRPVTVLDTLVTGPEGWIITPESAPEQAGGGQGNNFSRRETASVEARYLASVPRDAPLTQPYYLERRRAGDVYAWGEGALRSIPFAPPLLHAEVDLEIGGEKVHVTRPVEYRYADMIRGELRRDVNVVPAVSVGFDSPFLLVPTGTAPNVQRIVVRVGSFSRTRVNGTLQLQLPEGWRSDPVSTTFDLQRYGDRTAATFEVTAPEDRSPGSTKLSRKRRSTGRHFHAMSKASSTHTFRRTAYFGRPRSQRRCSLSRSRR